MGVGLLCAGCSQNTPLLANSYPSAEALAEAVVARLEERDANGLRAIALTEEEFRQHVWPELPAARPERNLPFSYVWGDLRQKSEAGLAATLSDHGGRRYTLVGVRFAGRTPYPSYVVHEESIVTIRDTSGETRDLRLFGSGLEKDDGWKVFSYVTDN